jgi:hypothetical protein
VTTCELCGAAVAAADVHADWHARLRAVAAREDDVELLARDVLDG